MSKSSKVLLANVLGVGVIKALNVVLGLLLVRYSILFLGEENYGVWLAMLSFFTWFSAFEVGISSSVRNLITKSFVDQDLTGVKKNIGKAFKALFIVYVILIFLIVGLSYFIDPSLWFLNNAEVGDNFQLVYRISAALYLLHFVFYFLYTVFFAIHKTAFSFLIVAIQNVLLLIGLIIMTELNVTLKFTSYVIWFTAVPLIIWILANGISFNGILSKFKPQFLEVLKKGIKPFETIDWSFFVMQVCILIIYATDNMIIVNQIGGEEVAVYNVSFRYFNMIIVVFNIVIVPYWSSFTEAYHKLDFKWIKKHVSILVMIWFACLLSSLIMIFWSKEAYSLWVGKDFHVDTSLSISMAVSVLLTAWNSIFSYFLNAASVLKLQRNILLISAVINVPLSLYFIPYFGVTGVVLATCISLLPTSIVLPIKYLKVVNHKVEV